MLIGRPAGSEFGACHPVVLKRMAVSRGVGTGEEARAGSGLLRRGLPMPPGFERSREPMEKCVFAFERSLRL